MDEESLFLAALELDPSERSPFLEQACGNNSRLKRRVEKLLQSHQHDTQFLVRPAIEQIAAVSSSASERDVRQATNELPLPESISQHLVPSPVAGSLGRLDHYDLLDVIGSGGFGIVVKAIDQNLQRQVAIKFLLSERSHSLEIRQRFLREARVAAAIQHANVVDIYAVEERPTPYIVMEFVEGETLDRWMQVHIRPSVEHVFSLSISIAEALAAAHAHGVIHRDIKPANILVDARTNQVKLMDFGLARAVDDTSVTQSPLVAGTPQFMSPEQAEGKRLDPRSDLFSLGSVLYFLSTNRPPFAGDSTLAVMKHICETQPPSIVAFNPDIPTSFLQIVNRLHSKSPSDRPSDASQVVIALREAMEEWRQPVNEPCHAKEPTTRQSTSRFVFTLPRTTILPPTIGALCLSLVWSLITQRAPESPDSATPATSLVATMPERRVYPLDDPASADDLDSSRISPTRLALAGNGDPLRSPAGLVAILAETRFSHAYGPNQNSGITDIACSPKDDRVAVASAIYSLSEHRFVAWELKIWQLDSGRLIHTFTDLPAPARGLVFSPDGKQFACICDQGTLIVSDADNWLPNWVAQAHSQRGRAIDWSRDGHWLVSGGDDGAAVWNASTGTNACRFQEHPEMLLDVNFSHQSPSSADSLPLPLPLPTLLVVSTDGHTTRVWRAANGERLGAVIATPDTVTRSVVFNPSRSAVMGAREDGTVTTWDIYDGQPRQEWRGHTSGVLQIARSFDGTRYATASLDGSIRLWDVTGTSLHIGPRHIQHASAVAFTTNGQRVVSGDTAGQVHVWDTSSGRCLSHQHLGPTLTVSCSPDGKYLASGGEDGNVRLWDLASGDMLTTLLQTGSVVRDLVWRADGKVLAVAAGESIFLVDARTAKLLKTHTSLIGPVMQLEFMPDGQQLFFLTQSAETQASLRTWRLSSSSARPFSASTRRSPQCFALSQDGQSLAIGEGPLIIVYDLATFRETMTLAGHTANIKSLAFDTESRRLASAAEKDDAHLIVWDLTTQTIQHRLDSHSRGSFGCQWRADGNLLASAGLNDGTVQFWNVTQNWPKPNVLPIFPSDFNSVMDLTLTPEGRHLITANADGTIFVIRLARRQKSNQE